MTTDHWAVTVSRHGEPIVTIESNCLSGRELDAEDEALIRMAADHLRAFVGASPGVGDPRGVERLLAQWRREAKAYRAIRRDHESAVDRVVNGESDMAWADALTKCAGELQELLEARVW